MSCAQVHDAGAWRHCASEGGHPPLARARLLFERCGPPRREGPLRAPPSWPARGRSRLDACDGERACVRLCIECADACGRIVRARDVRVRVREWRTNLSCADDKARVAVMGAAGSALRSSAGAVHSRGAEHAERCCVRSHGIPVWAPPEPNTRPIVRLIKRNARRARARLNARAPAVQHTTSDLCACTTHIRVWSTMHRSRNAEWQCALFYAAAAASPRRWV